MLKCAVRNTVRSSGSMAICGGATRTYFSIHAVALGETGVPSPPWNANGRYSAERVVAPLRRFTSRGFAGSGSRLFDDPICAFRQRIIPTRSRTFAYSFVVRQCEFHSIQYLSSSVFPLRPLPYDIGRDRYYQCPWFLPATQLEVRGRFERVL
jgi:hypothetical protein